MSEARKGCEKTVWDGMRRYPCQKSATRPAAAPRWCAIHDPIAKAEREAKRTAAFNVKWEAQRAAHQAREQAEAERNRKAARCDEALALLRRWAEWSDGDMADLLYDLERESRALLARADSEAAT